MASETAWGMRFRKSNIKIICKPNGMASGGGRRYSDATVNRILMNSFQHFRSRRLFLIDHNSRSFFSTDSIGTSTRNESGTQSTASGCFHLILGCHSLLAIFEIMKMISLNRGFRLTIWTLNVQRWASKQNYSNKIFDQSNKKTTGKI